MIDTLAALLGAGAIPQTTYAPNSRYYGLPRRTYQTADGRQISYVGRRFIPQPSRFATFQLHRVMQAERIDLVSAQFLADPLLYWRIADANLAVRPADVLRVGAYLRITLAAGIPGAPR